MQAEHDAECKNASGYESEDDVFRNRAAAADCEYVVLQTDGDEGKADDKDNRAAYEGRYKVVDGFAYDACQAEKADDKTARENGAEDGGQTVKARAGCRGNTGNGADGNVRRSLGDGELHEKTGLNERAQAGGNEGCLNEKCRILDR